MKNYNEMAQRVLERRDEYELEKKVRNRRLTRTFASLACVAVFGFAAISLAGDPDIPHDNRQTHTLCLDWDNTRMFRW